MDRMAAAALKLTRYSTGKPCRRGHLAERYVSTGACVQCMRGHSEDIAKTIRAARRGHCALTVHCDPEDARLVLLVERMLTEDDESRRTVLRTVLQTLRRPSDEVFENEPGRVELPAGPTEDETAARMTARGYVRDGAGPWLRLFVKEGVLLRPATELPPDDPRRAWPVVFNQARGVAMLTPPEAAQ